VILSLLFQGEGRYWAVNYIDTQSFINVILFVGLKTLVCVQSFQQIIWIYSSGVMITGEFINLSSIVLSLQVISKHKLSNLCYLKS